MLATTFTRLPRQIDSTALLVTRLVAESIHELRRSYVFVLQRARYGCASNWKGNMTLDRWPMRRPTKRSIRFWMSSGLAAGLIVWAYDFQFFLNAGGPETPIADGIRRASHLQDASNWLVFVFWPLIVLLGAGAVTGLALSWLLGGRRKTGV
jgi:hypothetical protein